MAKGVFTQAACVLLKEPVTLDAIESALEEFGVVRRVPANEHWELGGMGCLLDFRSDVNGFALVDIVEQPWPDHFGHPKEEPMLFGAWSMGHFGPYAFPGGMARAAQQSWAWDDGRSMPEEHGAFLRIRISYVLGGNEDAPVIPEDYDAIAELLFCTAVALALLDLPEALCYFNPSGEVLQPKEFIVESFDVSQEHEQPPLETWSNVRIFMANEAWAMMDTVGNWQLDMPDVEACFVKDNYDLEEINVFLRNLSLYLMSKDGVIDDGDTIDGPGEVTWQATNLEDSLCDPPRPVIRWFPNDSQPVPDMLQHAAS